MREVPIATLEVICVHRGTDEAGETLTARAVLDGGGGLTLGGDQRYLG